MDRSTLLSPWRVVLGLLPLCYAALLLIALPDTFFWAGIIGVMLLLLLVVVNTLGYPLIACWPAFSGVVLLLACGLMLYQGVPSESALPATHSPLELWVVGLLAGLVIGWGGVTAHRLMTDI
jgi:hypothetical protein